MLRPLLGTAVALTLAAAPAVPALGARPHVPEVVEFALDAPPAPARAAADRGFISRAVHTSKRFNLVGFSWQNDSLPAIALRTRKNGDSWTRWTPVGTDGVHGPRRSTSSPVWVGEADWVQYRMSRRVPELKLHFVNSMGTATRKNAPAWGASASQPRIHTREEWGGEQCPTRGVSYGRVKAAVIHHTVTANEYTRAQVPAAILAVCRFHRNTNGWNDIGYNFLVDRFGRLWEGRDGGIDEAVSGAHAQGYNSQTTGISNLGTFTSVPQTDAAISAMARLIAWKLANHGVRTGGTTRLTSAGGSSARYPYGYTRSFPKIIGHRDTGLTACPGEQLYFQLADLRKRVGERRPTGADDDLVAPLPELVTYSTEGYTFTGRLTDADGVPIAGAPVLLERLRRTGWRRLEEATTDSDGNFAATTRFKRNTVLRWEFAGDDTYRPFRGDGAAVSVAPLITLGASTTTAEPNERIDLSGAVGPPKSGEFTLIAQQDDGTGTWHRVARRKVPGSHGSFTWHKRFADEGEYRVVARYAGDLVNAPSSSAYLYITVEEPFFPF